MFGTSSTFGSRPNSIFSSGAASTNQNPLNDIEVPSPPDDTVEALKFNPQISGQPVLLVSGSWDSVIRVWQINESGQCEAKAQQNVGGPVLDLDWLDDGTKVFIASADKQVRVWDLASNQMAVMGTHDEPVRKCHWIKAPNYSCLMTGSWDKTLRFWDMRQLPSQTSLATVQLAERVYCSDVLFPMGVVGLANRRMKIYRLDNEPSEVKDIETPLKYQSRCASIFKDKANGLPTGYALGSIEGRVAIQYVEAANPKDNFTFKCHRSPELINGFQEIYAVNDIAFHPNYGTLATVGSDGRISFWDKDARTKLKTSDPLPAPVTRCVIHPSGQMMAYATGYDWSKGHEGYNPQAAGSKIFLHACDEDMKPKQKK
uniref:Anaphase-promoting complex subunit 4 WD40 domain-containing protein n=1 Tax=Setaria digitata TaxID=48799 RepID=A0A915PQR7_9BILA